MSVLRDIVCVTVTGLAFTFLSAENAYSQSKMLEESPFSIQPSAEQLWQTLSEEAELYEFFLMGGLDKLLSGDPLPPYPDAPRDEWEKRRKQNEEEIKRFQRILDKLKSKDLERWKQWLRYDQDGDGKLSRNELITLWKDKISCGVFSLLTCEERDQLVEEIVDRILCDQATPPSEPSGFDCRQRYLTKDGISSIIENTIALLELQLSRFVCSNQTDPKAQAICEKIKKLFEELIERLKKVKDKLIMADVVEPTLANEIQAAED